MISIIGMLSNMDATIFWQEIGQAFVWLCCAFIGWIASSVLLNYLGCKKGSKTKAKAGSIAFRQEVATHANKSGTHAAAHHYGLTEFEVQQYCCQLKVQQSSVNTSGSLEAAEETLSVPEAPLFTASSAHPGHVLLEHYNVFNLREGAWSGPLEDKPEETKPVKPSAHQSVPIPLSAFHEIKAEEYYEGDESLSLWLVPDGHVYDHYKNGWVTNAASP